MNSVRFQVLRIRWARLIVLTVALLLPVAGCTGEMPMNEPSDCPYEIIIIDLAPDLARLSGMSPQSLVAGAKDLLCRLFPDELALSRSARGLLLHVKTLDDRHILKLEAIFLYRASYTAVSHRVRIAVEGDAWRVISMD
jgi:hypothetical protein